jgi:hypothetical protein
MLYRKPKHNPSCASGNSDDAADLRLQRNVVKIRRLGDRALFELLRELGAITGHRAIIESVVARYAAIDRTHLYVTRGDRFAPRPLLLVRREP